MVDVAITGDAASAFRRHFNIDSAQQANDAVANADALFAAGGHPWAGDDSHMPNRETFDWAAQETKRRFDEGKYKDGELAKSKPQKDGKDLWGSARHVANDSNQWKAICTDPDYCKVGNSVVPFDSFATIGNQVQASPNVKAQDVPLYRVGDLHKGVQGDAGSHITAGTSLGSGHVKFLEGQNNVKANGIPVVRQDSACLVNCNGAGVGGAAGKVVTTQRSANTKAEEAKQPNKELQALLDAEADRRSFWQKTKDFAGSAWDSTKRIAGASADDPLDTGVGLFKGLGNLPTDLWNLGVLASKNMAVAGLPSVAMQARTMERGALAAYQAGDLARANALAGQAKAMMSSGYADDLFELTSDAQKGGSFLSMFVPIGPIKGVGTAGRVAREAKAVDALADTARTTEISSDAGRAADTTRATDTAGAGSKGETASDTSRRADSDQGVHVIQLSPAQRYADLVNSNKPWSWKKDFPDGDKLTAGEKAKIKRDAIESGLIPDIQFKEGTRFPDFQKAGLINKVDNLPEELWKAGDPAQFKWLDSRIPGGRPAGYTWHHSEIPGRMELVPFGPHNIINHQGGRSPGMWAAGNR